MMANMITCIFLYAKVGALSLVRSAVESMAWVNTSLLNIQVEVYKKYHVPGQQIVIGVVVVLGTCKLLDDKPQALDLFEALNKYTSSPISTTKVRHMILAVLAMNKFSIIFLWLCSVLSMLN